MSEPDFNHFDKPRRIFNISIPKATVHIVNSYLNIPKVASYDLSVV